MHYQITYIYVCHVVYIVTIVIIIVLYAINQTVERVGCEFSFSNGSCSLILRISLSQFAIQLCVCFHFQSLQCEAIEKVR